MNGSIPDGFARRDVPWLLSAYSRDNEREADTLGQQLKAWGCSR